MSNVTVRSLEFKTVNLSRPAVTEDKGIKGRGKDEQPNSNEKRGVSHEVAGPRTIHFVDGRAEVSMEVAEQLVREYPQSIFIEESKGK